MDRLNKKFQTDIFLLGVCYYPEHWQESMWEEDFSRMKEMGFNVVRMGETAWNVMEPIEGTYSFDLFDRAIALCKKHGLKVIMGTPTYAPPAWLTEKYPEALRSNFQGVPMAHGSRRHYNYTSPIYIDLCKKIVTRLVSHYSGNQSVIGWQIDNELNCHMDVSFAESDHAAFRAWCKQRYRTLEELNAAWGTSFWAQTYTDWSQVYLPRPTVTYHNPGHLLDFYRFTSDSTIEFGRIQYDIIKTLALHQFATHNGMFSNVDNHAFAERATDFMSFDSYPAFQLFRRDLPQHFRDRMTGKQLSRVRGISTKFLILEQQAGPGGQSGNVLNRHSFGDYLQATPKPGQMRLWAWQSAAHGADGVLFFRWRTCPYGAESLWHGLNHYGNQPHRRLEEAKQFADEIHRLGSIMVESECLPAAAILCDYDNDSNNNIDGYIGFDEWRNEESIYQSLNERHLLTDQISIRQLNGSESFNRYGIIFYANAQLLEESDVSGLRAYVEAGGTLVLGPRSGYKDRSNRCYMQPFPGVLRELTGIEVTDFTMVRDQPVRMQFLHTGTRLEAPVFNEILVPRHANCEVLATYCQDYYAGEAAVIRTRVGRGQVIYMGAFFSVENVTALLDTLQIKDPTCSWANIPKEVEVIHRRAADKDIYFLLNYTDTSQDVQFYTTAYDHLSGVTMEGTMQLASYGVWMIEAPAVFIHRTQPV